MRRAFDIEEKSVGAVLRAPNISAQWRSGRRIARRPERQPPQRGVIGGFVDLAGLQIIGLCTGISQWLTAY
jgi:hypothetical protein